MDITGSAIAASIDEYCRKTKTLKDEFFRSTGISSGTLAQWRTGKFNPSLKKIRSIENFVGMDIEKFILIYKKMPAAGSSGLSDEAREFVNLFSAVSPAMREAVLATLRAAAAQAEAAQDVQAVSE